jgi:hypothetical protein
VLAGLVQAEFVRWITSSRQYETGQPGVLRIAILARRGLSRNPRPRSLPRPWP